MKDLAMAGKSKKFTLKNMSEKDFLKRCEACLIELCQRIEEADKNSQLDVEYSDGILSVVIEATNQTYIINRHGASQKIWYSSPFTGANYFSFDENLQKWLDSKSDELEQKLFLELLAIFKS
jgi:iron donor protein CyaY